MSRLFDPFTEAEREAELAKPRPRQLPIAPSASAGRRNLPLAGESRERDRTWRPIYAVWEVTLQCDLACRHCGSRAGHARPDELSTEQCLDLVRQMAELGVKEVTLIGGEAYLRGDLTEIVRAIRAHGMSATMTTGGRGITPERALAAHAAGLESASVSIDGLEATHDRLRGVNGSFRAAFEAMQYFRDAGVRVACNTQINRLTMAELPSSSSESPKRECTAGKFSSRSPWDAPPTSPTCSSSLTICSRYFHSWESSKSAVLSSGFGSGQVTTWGISVPTRPPSKVRCRAGNVVVQRGASTLGIEADGAIKGCPSLPTLAWTGGNVRDHSLIEIWERAAPLRYTRDRTVDDLWGFCRTCYYAEECRAGCTWTSFVIFGKPGNNPYCHHRALEIQRQGLRERLVKVEDAPGVPFDYGRFEVLVEADPRSDPSHDSPPALPFV